jgi:hypothetical protein
MYRYRSCGTRSGLLDKIRCFFAAVSVLLEQFVYFGKIIIGVGTAVELKKKLQVSIFINSLEWTFPVIFMSCSK